MEEKTKEASLGLASNKRGMIDMTRITTNHIKVKVDIQAGPTSPAQKQAWRRFWRMILEVKNQ